MDPKVAAASQSTSAPVLVAKAILADALRLVIPRGESGAWQPELDYHLRHWGKGASVLLASKSSELFSVTDCPGLGKRIVAGPGAASSLSNLLADAEVEALLKSASTTRAAAWDYGRDLGMPWSESGSFTIWLAQTDGPQAIQLGVDGLHGRHGARVAQSVLDDMLNGIGFGGDFDIVLGFADYLLMEGRLDVIKMFVDSGVPRLFGDSQAVTQSCWLDILTKPAPGHGSFESEASASFVACAARRSKPQSRSGHADGGMPFMGALQYAWDLNQKHPDFDRISRLSGEDGAVVGAFMAQQRAAMTEERPARAETSTSTSAPPRMR